MIFKEYSDKVKMQRVQGTGVRRQEIRGKLFFVILDPGDTGYWTRIKELR